MSEATRFQRARDLLDQADTLPADRRADYLHRACPDDPELVADVLAMLNADAAWLDRSPAGSAFEAATVDAPQLPDIPGFEIVGQLGVGGMGVVYEAKQLDPHRHVAIKVQRIDVSDTHGTMRFSLEARALARLQHPGIAQIYDARTVRRPDGTSLKCIVMELVAGPPLLEHIYRAVRKLSDRVTIAIRLCEAVAHAHQKQIIHRDLKPSNLKFDTSGNPKILDFGIARFQDMASNLTRGPDSAGVVSPIGTLQYMSPEQAAGDPADLDTRSDIYSLGLVIYQILSDGELPYHLPPDAVDPVTRIVQAKHDPLSKWDRTLAGDLTTIVAKATHPDRERRYATAMEFAADLRRYLAQEPILARPPSASYRFSRFVRRNRLGVVAATVVLLSLVGTAVVSTVSLVRVSEQKAIAQKERDTAVRQLSRATHVTQFMDMTLAKVSADDMGSNAPIGMLIGSAAAYIESGALAGEPQVEVDVRLSIGSVAVRIGEYETADRMLPRGLELARTMPREGHSGFVSIAKWLATLRRQQTRWEESEKYFLQALAQMPNTFAAGDDPPLLPATATASAAEVSRAKLETGTRVDLANLYCMTARPEKAEAQLDAVVKPLGVCSPGDSVERANYLSARGFVAAVREQPEICQTFMQQAMDMQRRVDKGPSASASLLMRNLSKSLIDLQKWGEAEGLLRKCVENDVAAFGPGGGLDPAQTLANLSFVQLCRGEVDAAAESGDRALAMFQKFHAIPPLIAKAQYNQAWVLAERGRLPQADALMTEALGTYTNSLGQAHPATLNTLDARARLRMKMGQFSLAHADAQRSLDLRRQSYGADSPAIAEAWMTLYFIRLRENPPVAELQAMLTEALRIRLKSQPPDLRETIVVRRELAAVLGSQNKLDDAKQMLDAAWASAARNPDIRPNDKRDLAGLYVQLYELKGDPVTARNWAGVADAEAAPATTRP